MRNADLLGDTGDRFSFSTDAVGNEGRGDADDGDDGLTISSTWKRRGFIFLSSRARRSKVLPRPNSKLDDVARLVLLLVVPEDLLLLVDRFLLCLPSEEVLKLTPESVFLEVSLKPSYSSSSMTGGTSGVELMYTSKIPISWLS